MRRFSSFLLHSVPRHLSKQKMITTPQRDLRQSHSYRFLFSSTTVKNSHVNSYLPSLSLQGNTLLATKQQQYAHFSSTRNRPEVETISKEFIKPATPTPEHSRMYEVSLLDQIIPHFYMSFVYFYPNNHKNDDSQPLINHHDDLISKRRQLLKQSLSETLTRFYPLAGRIKDGRHIDCNDDGVYYVETKVGDLLSDFLKHPDNKSIHRLLPLDPNSKELLFKNYLAMVQVNVFSCGGIAIGLYTSHKIMDGCSIATFFKAWAATARDEDHICPSFIAPSIFPCSPTLPETAIVLPPPPQIKTTTRRFVFRAPSLATLKQKAESSRVMAVTGLIWKCAMEASSKARRNRNTNDFSLKITVNLRERSSPPMPPYCIGNIAWTTSPIKCSAGQDLGLDSIAQRIKHSANRINGDFIEIMKGKEFSRNLEATINERIGFYSDEANSKNMLVTSICNSGTHETDFGWGKPIWISVGNADLDTAPLCQNYATLMDTSSGNGIEAWVNLSEEDMAFFERDPELLCFASLNPNPLHA